MAKLLSVEIGLTDELNDRTPIQRNRHAELNKAKSSEKDRSAFRSEIRRAQRMRWGYPAAAKRLSSTSFMLRRLGTGRHSTLSVTFQDKWHFFFQLFGTGRKLCLRYFIVYLAILYRL